MKKMTQAERERHKAEKRPGTTWGCCCEDCMEDHEAGRMVTAKDLKAVVAWAEGKGPAYADVESIPALVRKLREGPA